VPFVQNRFSNFKESHNFDFLDEEMILLIVLQGATLNGTTEFSGVRETDIKVNKLKSQCQYLTILFSLFATII